MKLDEKLVLLRKKKGITQLELAEAVKVSRQAVSKWESGVAIPSTENLRGLSELYGVPVNVLLNDELDVPANEAGNKLDTATDKRVRNDDKGKQAILVFVLILMAIIVLSVIITHDGRNGKDSGDILIPIDELKTDNYNTGESLGLGVRLTQGQALTIELPLDIEVAVRASTYSTPADWNMMVSRYRVNCAI